MAIIKPILDEEWKLKDVLVNDIYVWISGEK